MRRRAALALPVLLACAPAQKSATARGLPPVAPASAIATIEAAPTQAPPPAPPAAPDEAALKARRAEELAWATERFPEIATYLSEQQADAMRASLLSWAKPGESITVFDPACRPAVVTRREDVYFGRLTRSIERTGGTIAESFDELSIGSRMEEFSCNGVDYERNAAGKWVVEASYGMGCARSIGLALSQVTETAAWYAAAAVVLSLDCMSIVTEVNACADNQLRTCNRCEEWMVQPHSRESTFGIGSHPHVRRVSLPPAPGCDRPCTVHPPPPDVKRANEALRDVGFLYVIDEEAEPLVFRTRQACRSYRKSHPLSRDDEAWSAGKPRPAELPPLYVEDE